MEIVAVDPLPVGQSVPPEKQIVAQGVGDRCPAQIDGAGCGLGVDHGCGEVGMNGSEDLFGPVARLAVSV